MKLTKADYENDVRKKRDFNDVVNDFLDSKYCKPICYIGLGICILVIIILI